MGEHSVVHFDQLVKTDEVGSGLPVDGAKHIEKKTESAGPSSSAVVEDMVVGMGKEKDIEVADEVADEEAPLIGIRECRICQEEDSVKNLETPCACSGSLKYAHRNCVQHWCNEKGDITCEICHQPYQPGYTAPPRSQPEETTIDIGGWQISGTPLDLHDPRLLALAEAERQILEAEYDDYNATNASGAAFCRSAALILMALLLLRHALSMTDSEGDDEDPSALFSLFLLRVVGFLLPCYIMVWAISILQQRRQRQEAAAALAASQFAIVVQSAQRTGVHFTIASTAPPVPAAHEHV